MIVLKQELKTMNSELKGLEKKLSECWDEKVVIIPHGYSLVGFIDEMNEKAFENKKDKSSGLFNINKKQLSLIKAGLEARDDYNVKIIKAKDKSFEGLYSKRTIVANCRKEHEEILTLIKDIDKILNDSWYGDNVNFKVTRDL